MLDTLAVVILSFNKKERTARAVRDTLDQTQKWEQPTRTVLVHNGSLAQNVLDLQGQFPEVDHLVLPENKGYSGGMNAGLDFVFQDHTWVLAVSNDCVLLNEPGSDLFSVVALVAPIVYRRKSGQVESCGGYCDWTSAQLRHARTPDEFLAIPKSRRYIPGSCFLIHREVFQKTGGFNETLHTYWEDVDLSLRAHRLNFPLIVSPYWQVRHDIGRTCHGQSLYTLFYFQRNRIATLRTFAPAIFKPWIAFRLALDFIKLYLRLNRARVADRKLLQEAIRQGLKRDFGRRNPLRSPAVPPTKGRAEIHPSP